MQKSLCKYRVEYTTTSHPSWAPQSEAASGTIYHRIIEKSCDWVLLKKSLAPSSLHPPFRCLYTWIWDSPLSLFFSRLHIPSSLSLSSQEICSNPSIIFMVLFWTLSSRLSVFSREPRTECRTSNEISQVLSRGEGTPCLLGSTFSAAEIPAHRFMFSLVSMNTSPVHVQLGVHEHSQVYFNQFPFHLHDPLRILANEALPHQLQDFALLAELAEVPASPDLQPVRSLWMATIPSGWPISHSSHVCVITYSLKVYHTLSWRWLMKMLSRTRLSMDPWGTLLFSILQLDFALFINTFRAQPFSLLSIQFSVCPSSHYSTSLRGCETLVRNDIKGLTEAWVDTVLLPSCLVYLGSHVIVEVYRSVKHNSPLVINHVDYSWLLSSRSCVWIWFLGLAVPLLSVS